MATTSKRHSSLYTAVVVIVIVVALAFLVVSTISGLTSGRAEAQIAIKENGVGIVDQSNVEQTTVQVLNQEACTNESGEQSNDCEVDQTQNANIRTRHDTVKNSIGNIR